MFNTQLFIVEVQKRACLWNVKDSSHSDRQLKLRAWDQIANVLNTSNDSYSLNNKDITIDELQRKWKHLRDYYIREKKRTSKTDNNIENNDADKKHLVARKRKSPLLDMLQFLDANRGTDIVQVTTERNITGENFYPESNEEDDSSIFEYVQEVTRSPKIQKTETQHPQTVADSRRTEAQSVDNEDNAEKQFLTSLLPIIKNMNTKERLNFRAQLMNPTPPQDCPLLIDKEEKSKTIENRKQLKISRKSEEIEVVNKEMKSDETTPKRDEFSIYGEYVANKLRNIRNKQARHTAEFHINSILYKAEMGGYDTVSRVTNSTRFGSSRESSRIISSVDLDESDCHITVIKTEVLD